MNITANPKYINNKQIHLNILRILFQCSHQHVSAGIPAIFRVTLLRKENKHTNLVNCVTITP